MTGHFITHPKSFKGYDSVIIFLLHAGTGSGTWKYCEASAV